MKNKQTSSSMAKLAGKTLASRRASKRSKSLAASALAQAVAVEAEGHKRRVAASKRRAV